MDRVIAGIEAWRPSMPLDFVRVTVRTIRGDLSVTSYRDFAAAFVAGWTWEQLGQQLADLAYPAREWLDARSNSPDRVIATW